ncbi:hypothetical protein [Candidatus Nitrotoga fabula]|uniref:hypothetical protein n=1 Tax=Candidatus Nitrotoga fabula TaxID=2182327 RepID=UPI001BB47A0A|nr:hypothetical protein [Candidatus Nitrotoga fabula]
MVDQGDAAIFHLKLPRLIGRFSHFQQGIKSAVRRKDFSVLPSVFSQLFGICQNGQMNQNTDSILMDRHLFGEAIVATIA